jgi:hypothetical protein
MGNFRENGEARRVAGLVFSSKSIIAGVSRDGLMAPTGERLNTDKHG